MDQGLGKKLSALGVMAVVGLAAVPNVHAALIWSATIGTSSACAVDQNAFACTHGTQMTDTNPTPGVLSFTATSLGGVIIGLNAGSEKDELVPVFGRLNSLGMFIFNIIAGSSVSGTMALGDTGYPPAATTAFTNGSGTWIGAPDSTITMTWYNDSTNAQGAETPSDRPGLLVDTFTDSAVGLSDSFNHGAGPFAVSDPGLYSMTLGFNFTFATGGGRISELRQAETKLIVSAVPEPATLALLGIALAGLGFRRRKREAN